MITINSNTTAVTARNNLYASQSALNDNMLQLSTGKRINSAADDAAGLQISNRMSTQMSGLGVAQRNANDAISMAQTAEGAMSENTKILNRMRDLSLQSANDTNTKDDRDSLQQEVESLKGEIDRIASKTNFAGIELLDGSAKNLTFQVGSNANETISFSIGDMSASALGGTVYSETITSLGDWTTNADGTLSGDTTITLSDSSGTNKDVSVTLTDGMTKSEAADALNQLSGVGAVVDENGDLVLTGSGLSGYDKVSNDSAKDISITGAQKSVADIDISTAVGAQEAVQILDGALKQVDEQRAELGAFQNTAEYTVSNLANIEENLGVSQNQILNADFAQQTVEMTSNQMLMQAGTTVLAQAKTMPQYATMLL